MQSQMHPQMQGARVPRACAVCGERGDLRCARCLCVAYCSRACQARDFKSHVDACRSTLAFRVLNGDRWNCDARARLDALLKRVGVRGVRERAASGDVELQWQWGLRCAVAFSPDAMQVLEHNFSGDDSADGRAEWSEALTWMRQAAAAGLPDAQYAAALMIQTAHEKTHAWRGDGALAPEADALFRQAAKQGHPSAMLALSQHLASCLCACSSSTTCGRAECDRGERVADVLRWGDEAVRAGAPKARAWTTRVRAAEAAIRSREDTERGQGKDAQCNSSSSSQAEAE